MRYIDLQVAFELEINKLDDGLNKPKSDDIEYWLNVGLDKFVKTRYSGVNSKGESFEQSQKRIDDLHTLVTNKTYYTALEINIYDMVYPFLYGNETSLEYTIQEDCYSYKLPIDYLNALGETVYITSTNTTWPVIDSTPVVKRTNVLEATVDNLNRKLSNSLSEHRLHANYARPIRLFSNDAILLYTDRNYTISKYTLTYLRLPKRIDIHTNPFDEYNDMPIHTHIEIIKLAVHAYLENQTNQRYNSYSNEISTME